LKSSHASKEEAPNGNNVKWNLTDEVDSAGFKDVNVQAYVTKLCEAPQNTEEHESSEMLSFPTDLWSSRRRTVISVEDEACYLGRDIVHFVLAKRGILRLVVMPPAGRKAAEVLRKIVDKLNKNNEFDSMLQLLDSSEIDGFATFKVDLHKYF